MFKKWGRKEGNKKSEDKFFTPSEWHALTLKTSEEIRRQIDFFKLEGRKVKRIKMIGRSYIHTGVYIADYVHGVIKQYEGEERQNQSLWGKIDSEIKFRREALIDQPLMVEFDNGETFEIDTPQVPNFCMTMNGIPWEIKCECNVDADILFAPCIGKRIVNVEARTYRSDKDVMTGCFFNEDHSEYKLVSDLVLWFDNGYGLSIGGHLDFCGVSCIDRRNEPVFITFRELKPALSEWEDSFPEGTNYSR